MNAELRSLVAAAMHAAREHTRRATDCDMCGSFAKIAVDTLAAAGRLLPEPLETRTEWQVIYSSNNEESAQPAECRKCALKAVDDAEPWIDARVESRTVTAGPWVPVGPEETIDES